MKSDVEMKQATQSGIDEELRQEIWDASVRLDRWFENNGWSGWDPFDIKANRLYRDLTSGQATRVIRFLTLHSEIHFPLLLRRLFGVRRMVNAKAIGLLTAAYVNLFRATEIDVYLRRAQACGDWLLRNTSCGYGGLGWGYPFDWHTRVLIPKGTPSSVVSSTVGDGLWLLYHCTGQEQYLDACQGVCEFFLSHLNKTFESSDAMCFSYTPVDDFQVHNANLFVAEFLIRIGKEVGDDRWINEGIMAANFALKEQNSDGSLCYWGKSQEAKYSHGHCWIDHFHSGFEIRMLCRIWKHTGMEAFKQAYQVYYDFYLNNLYLDGAIPKYTPDNLYPIDMHSCAEAILCNATLLPDHPEALGMIQNVFRWTMQTMEYEPGCYAYMVTKTRFGQKRIDIPFIRWGQAWMLRALSEVLVQIPGSTLAP